MAFDVALAGHYAYVAAYGTGSRGCVGPVTRLALSWVEAESHFIPERAREIAGPWQPVPGTITRTNGMARLLPGDADSSKVFRLQGGFGVPTRGDSPASRLESRDRGPSLSSDGLTLAPSPEIPAPHERFEEWTFEVRNRR